MAQDPWQRRIQRAEELGGRYGFAAEILRFYVAIARFQQRLAGELAKMSAGRASSDPNRFAQPLPRELAGRFESFLSVVEANGTGVLRAAAGELRERGRGPQVELLSAFWDETEKGALPSGPKDFFARAFLQPHAEQIRLQSKSRPVLPGESATPYVCPFCGRKPGFGVLRPAGDGGRRSLVCSFCLAEWEFRRIVCAACGEENYLKLPVYSAEDLDHVRVEACDTCKSYIKTVDLTKGGLAEPIVDELASIPLDLWAEERGYAKLQRNLLQL